MPIGKPFAIFDTAWPTPPKTCLFSRTSGTDWRPNFKTCESNFSLQSLPCMARAQPESKTTRPGGSSGVRARLSAKPKSPVPVRLTQSRSSAWQWAVYTTSHSWMQKVTVIGIKRDWNLNNLGRGHYVRREGAWLQGHERHQALSAFISLCGLIPMQFSICRRGKKQNDTPQRTCSDYRAHKLPAKPLSVHKSCDFCKRLVFHWSHREGGTIFWQRLKDVQVTCREFRPWRGLNTRRQMDAVQPALRLWLAILLIASGRTYPLVICKNSLTSFLPSQRRWIWWCWIHLWMNPLPMTKACQWSGHSALADFTLGGRRVIWQLVPTTCTAPLVWGNPQLSRLAPVAANHCRCPCTLHGKCGHLLFLGRHIVGGMLTKLLAWVWFQESPPRFAHPVSQCWRKACHWSRSTGFQQGLTLANKVEFRGCVRCLR